MQTVRTEDPDGQRFEIVQENNHVWQLMAEDFEAMITWMDELRARKQELQGRSVRPNASQFASGETASLDESEYAFESLGDDVSISARNRQESGKDAAQPQIVKGLALEHRQEVGGEVVGGEARPPALNTCCLARLALRC